MVYGVWLIAVLIQILFFILIFNPLRTATNKITNTEAEKINSPDISLVLVVKNEAENLKILMPLLFTQEYIGNWNIHVLDDQSTDGTAELMGRWILDIPKLNFHRTADDRLGKKNQLRRLKEINTFNHYLFTDADCRPGRFWIKEMANALSGGDIVLGYSPYERRKDSINPIIQLETQYAALLYLGLANKGNAYMGVGRNVLYKKAIFHSSDSLQKHARLLSGDDDLMVNDLGGKADIKICLNEDSFVQSVPKTNWKDWIKQKSRHVTTARYYKLNDQLLLTCFYGSLILSWAFVPLLFLYDLPGAVSGIFFAVIFYLLYRNLIYSLFKYKWSFVVWFSSLYSWLGCLIYLTRFAVYKQVDKW